MCFLLLHNFFAYPPGSLIYLREEDRQMENSILRLFPAGKRSFWEKTVRNQQRLQEIRLRVDRPLILKLSGKEVFLTKEGNFTEDKEQAVRVPEEEMLEILQHVCSYSFYAYEEELKRGYLTAPGGHRIGVAGQAVLSENGQVRSLKNISFRNIRVAHECKGAADGILEGVYHGGNVRNVLILSEPGGGKTTLLRDLVRQISDGCSYGRGRSVGVVDERSEIAGCYQGKPQLDVWMRTDVMDGCPKMAGMMMLLRSMAPEVLAVDELGSREELEVLKGAAACGCLVLATAHGNSLEDLVKRFGIEDKVFRQLFSCLVLPGGVTKRVEMEEL